MGARFFLARRRCYPPPREGIIKKITRGGPIFLSFLLVYKRPVDKQKTHNFGPPQAKKKVYIVYTMGKHNKRAAGEKKYHISVLRTNFKCL